jgi:branched-chain amino acid transport system permease protein
VLAAFCGAAVGFPALRLRGLYLAIASLGFVFLVTTLIENWPYLGGRLGFSGMAGADAPTIWTATVLLGVAMLLLDRSRAMLAFRAVRENEFAAASLGVRITNVRVAGFALGAAVAGLAGGFWAHYILFIDPTQFGPIKSFEIVLFVVLGGIGAFWGPAIGATAMTLLPVWVRPLQDYREVAFAVLLIAMMALRPEGLLSTGFGQRLRGGRRKREATGGAPAIGPIQPQVSFASSGALLDVVGVSKRFDGLQAVDDVSFKVVQGEVVAVIGPNGAGKTTLFNCIAGLLSADSGRIGFHGVDIVGLPAHRIAAEGIARTFQNGSVFADLTVIENVMAGCHLTESRLSLGSSSGRWRCCSWSAFSNRWRYQPASSPTATNAASRSCVRWPRAPNFCYSTNRQPVSTIAKPKTWPN